MLKRLFLALVLVPVFSLAACTVESGAPPTGTAVSSPSPADAQPAAPQVLISEVLTGVDGNNSVEFIELTNTATAAPFDLKGWSLWYKLADGQEETLVIRWREHTLIPPQGHYLLVREGHEAELGILADAFFETSMVPVKGGLQLRATDGTVLDSLAWGDGPADFAEGAPAPAMENGVSLERAPGGAAGNFGDTDDNARDFALNPAPDPQNTGSPLTPDPGAQLRIAVTAPQTAEPGGAFTYEVAVTNDTGGDVHNLSVQLLIPLDLTVGELPPAVSLGEQAAFWGLEQIGRSHQVAVWRAGDVPAGETVSIQIPVETPWSVMTVTLANYSAQAEGFPLPAFGGPVRTSIEGGVVPIGNLPDLVGAELTVEGTATLQTGALYAGGGNVKFYLEDETGGVQVWVPGGEGEVNVGIGARVRARGELTVYRGALELIVNDPADVEILAGQSENPPVTPAAVSIPDAASDPQWRGKLITVEGRIARNDEQSYSYEIDLMDENGETLPLYVDKRTGINVETIEVGDLYRVTGILEIYNTTQQLYPRIQSDFERIYPPELMLELDAPISVVTGSPFTVTLTAVNHTPDPLTGLVITGTLPWRGASFVSASEGGEVQGHEIVWRIPELAGNGESASSASVQYVLEAAAAEGFITLEGYSAAAAEWHPAVTGEPHFVFLGDTVPIWAIQGSGFRSPYVMQPVTTQGIVTGVFPDLGGFWIQETATDTDPLTSEGLFINLRDAEIPVVPGDEVQVSGIVRETSGQTQLAVESPETDITVLDAGNPLPPAVELDPPPDAGEAETYYEALEGMLVQVSEGVAVGPTSKYGEFVLVPPDAGADRLWQGDEARNGIAIMVDDGSSMTHEDASTLPYAVDTGDRVSGVVGPLAFTYGRYKIEPITRPQLTDAETPLPALTPTGPAEFSVMTWNVENLFDTRAPHPSSPPMLKPSEYRLRIQKIAGTIQAAGAPLIVGLQEVENIAVLEDIAAAEPIADYGYQALLIEGFDGRGIDVGYLIRGDRVTLLDLEQYPAPEGLTSRPPLVVKAEIQTEGGAVTLYVINNHFTSMSAGVEATEPRRTAQAAWVVEVMDGILADDPDAYIAVIGDLNSFYDSLPLDTLRKAGLRHVFEILPEEERYSYIYQGLSQTLDHILVTPNLFDLLTRVEVLHANADYAPALPGDPSPRRASDHDPVVATFTR